tara:strand:+ start:921 stop:3593 length:2673 start_codon:yes stop_codon:yes gene_type:complete
MTKTKFKYGGSGESLFKPQKEAKAFQPFNKQAAARPVLDALDNNMRAEIASVKATGDYGLRTMEIEQANELATAKHNAYVERVNDNIKLEQFTQFSQGAMSLFQQGLKIRKENQLNAGMATLMKMKTEKPVEYQNYLDNHAKFEQINGKYADEDFVNSWIAGVDNKDPGLAKAFLDRTGWDAKAISNGMLADKIAHMGKQWNDNLKTVPRDVASMLTPQDRDLAIADGVLDLNNPMTYVQVTEAAEKKFGSKLLPDYMAKIDNSFRGMASGDVIKSFKPGQLVDYATMLAKVEPALTKISTEGAMLFQERSANQTVRKLGELRDLGPKTILDESLGHGQNYTAVKLNERNDKFWPTAEGTTEAEKRHNLWKSDLESLLRLQEQGHGSANLVELYGVFNGQVGSRGLANGKTKSLGELHSKVFEEVDFLNRAEKQALLRDGLKKKTRANGKKMMLAAAATHVRTNGVLSTVEVREFARAGAARGWGTEKDLTLALMDAMPTELGRSLDEWVDEVKRRKSKTNGPLNPEDFLKMGAPKELIEDSRLEGVFDDDPKWSISTADQTKIEGQLASNFTGIKDKTVAVKDLSHEQQWAGQNAYQKFFIGEYQRLKGEKGDSNTPAQIRNQAIINTQAWMKDEKNWGEIEVKPDLLTKNYETSKSIEKQILSTPTGRADSTVIEEFREQTEWFWKKKYPALKKAHPNMNPMGLVTSDMQWVDSNGMKKDFFSPVWNNAEARSRSPNLLLDQGTALNVEIEQEQPLPGDKSEKFKPLYKLDNAKLSKMLLKSGNELIGRSYKAIPFDEFFVVGMGVALEPFEAALAEDGHDMQTYYRKFLRERGLKNADTLNEESQNQLRTILFNTYPEAYPDAVKLSDIPREPVKYKPIWEYFGGKR